MNIHLLIIDPQNDFMDIDGATLQVPGANEDMIRLASMIDRVGPKLEDIHVTMDSHRFVDVGHPIYWKNSDGNRPSEYIEISADDIENSIWTPRNPAWRQDQLESAKRREAEGNKKKNMVWPVHCLIGTHGWCVQETLMKALLAWEENEFANVDYVTKGSYPHREHYGAFMAEDPDPREPTTSLNSSVLNVLVAADIVAVAGEALSHCVMETVNQAADNIGNEHIKKFHILTDCSSPVAAVPGGPDFPAIAKKWLKEMESRGMTLTSSEEFLA